MDECPTPVKALAMTAAKWEHSTELCAHRSNVTSLFSSAAPLEASGCSEASASSPMQK